MKTHHPNEHQVASLNTMLALPFRGGAITVHPKHIRFRPMKSPQTIMNKLAISVFALISFATAAFAQRTATATAIVVNHFVVHIDVTDGGAGYTLTDGAGGTIAPPAVTITGGGGSGAAAVATVSNGVVAQISMTSLGSNYTSPPTVLVEPPPPVVKMMAIQRAPMLVVNGEPGRSARVEHAEAAAPTQWFTITNIVLDANAFQWIDDAPNAEQRHYRAASVPPDPSPTACTATATATAAYGYVVQYTVTDGGANYWTAPSVTILGDGTNAAASATISNGVVTQINILNFGSGYSSATVVISPPPRVTTLAEYRVPQITLRWPVPTNMVLQSTAALGGTNSWADLAAIVVSSNPVVWVDTSCTQGTRFYQLGEPIIRLATWPGGIVASTNGNYRTIVFLSSGWFDVLDGWGPIESLVVAGGGSGGTTGIAGGGGAGGLIYTSFDNSRIYGPDNYQVVVGAGGPSQPSGGPYYGTDGGASSFGPFNFFGDPEITARGGASGKPQGSSAGRADGGSGGGNGLHGTPGAGISVPGTRYGQAVPEGNQGGSGNGGGGGGGAGTAGQNASTPDFNPGPGGDGVMSPLVTGDSRYDTYYAGGGGGGCSSSVQAPGGKGGGGGGSHPYSAGDGVPNSGGGGGGGAYTPGNNFRGGSGIVILKYRFR